MDGALVAFAATRDLTRSRAFYEGVLGLTFTGENPFAHTYDAGGTMLRVTLVESHAPPSYTVLGWQVADLQVALAPLAAAGVVFARYDGFEQDDDGVWTAPSGTRIVWFPDPDGNLLSLEEQPVG
jgi:catechol 2,3-dioxygenase-like lactoylglutathione lyase family enzyme